MQQAPILGNSYKWRIWCQIVQKFEGEKAANSLEIKSRTQHSLME